MDAILSRRLLRATHNAAPHLGLGHGMAAVDLDIEADFSLLPQVLAPFRAVMIKWAETIVGQLSQAAR
jgi:hypothetical protein